MQEIIQKYNTLLSSYIMLYHNTQSFHWNVSGPNFKELHALFEDIYTELQETCDLIAERILALEGEIMAGTNNKLKESFIEDGTNIMIPDDMIAKTMEDFTKIVEFEKEMISMADELGDEGSIDLLGELVREHEKIMWMLRVTLA